MLFMKHGPAPAHLAVLPRKVEVLVIPFHRQGIEETVVVKVQADIRWVAIARIGKAEHMKIEQELLNLRVAMLKDLLAALPESTLCSRK